MRKLDPFFVEFLKNNKVKYKKQKPKLSEEQRQKQTFRELFIYFNCSDDRPELTDYERNH